MGTRRYKGYRVMGAGSYRVIGARGCKEIQGDIGLWVHKRIQVNECMKISE